jgi:hypothetical protein
VVLEAAMNVKNRYSMRALCAVAMALLGAQGAQASQGLVAPPADTLWPQWQARVAVQTSVATPLGLWQTHGGGSAPRSGQGAAVFGDYYFAQPSFGSFRASGGMLFGAMGGAPLLQVTASSRLGLQTLGGGSPTGAESPGAVPYLGLGFTTAAWRNAWSLSADLGWVAEQPSAFGGVGRAIFGNQGWETALREIRLAPVLQLGVRYAF